MVDGNETECDVERTLVDGLMMMEMLLSKGGKIGVTRAGGG